MASRRASAVAAPWLFRHPRTPATPCHRRRLPRWHLASPLRAVAVAAADQARRGTMARACRLRESRRAAHPHEPTGCRGHWRYGRAGRRRGRYGYGVQPPAAHLCMVHHDAWCMGPSRHFFLSKRGEFRGPPQTHCRGPPHFSFASSAQALCSSFPMAKYDKDVCGGAVEKVKHLDGDTSWCVRCPPRSRSSAINVPVGLTLINICPCCVVWPCACLASRPQVHLPLRGP
jgi:hypothetical protein